MKSKLVIKEVDYFTTSYDLINNNKHKNGDRVIAIRRTSGKEVEGIATRMDNYESYIIPDNGDGFYCNNKNIRKISN